MSATRSRTSTHTSKLLLPAPDTVWRTARVSCGTGPGGVRATSGGRILAGAAPVVLISTEGLRTGIPAVTLPNPSAYLHRFVDRRGLKANTLDCFDIVSI